MNGQKYSINSLSPKKKDKKGGWKKDRKGGADRKHKIM